MKKLNKSKVKSIQTGNPSVIWDISVIPECLYRGSRGYNGFDSRLKISGMTGFPKPLRDYRAFIFSLATSILNKYI